MQNECREQSRRMEAERREQLMVMTNSKFLSLRAFQGNRQQDSISLRHYPESFAFINESKSACSVQRCQWFSAVLPRKTVACLVSETLR
jgi:hypothetical protein